VERVRWRSRLSAKTDRRDRNLFLFVGADPATGCSRLRRHGRPRRLRVTGAQCREERRAAVSALELVPGVFAVGDVRSGSVKRVGGAIGEGAQVVAALPTSRRRRETGALT